MVGKVARTVNKQIFKVEFKKIFFFFLTVLFCCNFGENGLNLMAGYKPIKVSHQKYQSFSENEVIVLTRVKDPYGIRGRGGYILNLLGVLT